MPSKNIFTAGIAAELFKAGHRSQQRRRSLRRSILSPGKLIFFFFLLLFGILILLSYYFERQNNDSLGSFFNDHFLSLLLFQEYVDRPKSIGAQISLTLLWLVALVFSGAAIGKISSFFIISAIGRTKSMGKKKDHYIICNHNWRTEGIITQINAYQEHNKQKSPIIIVNTEHDEKIDALAAKHENVNFQQLDPTHYESLEGLGACDARCIILLIDYKVIDSDAKNALIALAVNKLKEEEKKKHGENNGLTEANKKLHIVAEARQTERTRHLQDAGVDEVISSIDLSVGLIAQAAIHSKSSEIYSKLLHFTADTNELYYVENYSLELLGKSFTSAAHEIAEKTSASDNPVILIGLKRNDELLINPRKEKNKEELKLEPGDILVVLSYHKPEDL